MINKQLVDDRVNSAINEGLESQQAARGRKTKPGRLGLVSRLLARLYALRLKKMEKGIPLTPQRSELAKKT